MMSFKFEHPINWQRSMDFGDSIQDLAKSFSMTENLISLLKSEEQLIPLP